MSVIKLLGIAALLSAALVVLWIQVVFKVTVKRRDR